MGLPIWREPGFSADATSSSSKPKSDLTARHAQARSSIRRQPSVRIPNPASTSTSTRPLLLHRHLRSPPPQPPTRSVPPVPPLPRPAHADLSPRHRQPMPREPDSFWAPLDHLENAPLSPIPDPLPSEYRPRPRPRSRRGTNTENAADEMPPLRRMTHRSITASPPSLLDDVDSLSVAPVHLHDPSVPIPGEASDDADAHQWETLLTTITPDPSLPSASSSFTSAAATSFPRAPQGPVRPLRQRHRRALQRGPVVVRAPPSPESSQSPSRGGPDDFCPTDLDLDAQEGSGAPGSTSHESAQTSTYRRLLDTAHAFHHSYEHLDFYFAEFVNAFSRHERTSSEAREVLRAMEEMTVALCQAYERRQRPGGPASGHSSFRSLSENESPDGAALLPATSRTMTADSSSGGRTMSREERLRAMSDSVSEEELNELRELARGEDTPEMRSRGLRLSLRLLDSIGQVLLR